MKQMTFADTEYAGKRKQTRKELFLIEMDQVVPWKGLVALIKPYYPKDEGGRPAYPLMAMLRVHLMQNWFGYSDPAMERWSGRSLPAAVRIRSWISAALCTKPSARSRRPRRRYAPRPNTRSG